MLEITVAPSILDAHVGILDFLVDPLGNYLIAQRVFVHVLYHLVVVAQCRAMSIDAVGQFHDNHYLTVVGGIRHDERLRHLAYRHGVYCAAHLLRQLSIWNRVVPVSPFTINPRLNRVFLSCDKPATASSKVNFSARMSERTESSRFIASVRSFFSNLRAQQDVSGVDAVAALLDKLNYVVAIGCFNYLGHLLGVIQVKSGSGIFRLEMTATEESGFHRLAYPNRPVPRSGEWQESRNRLRPY